MENLQKYVIERAAKAKEAFKTLGNADTNLKNSALIKMADALIENTDCILNANSMDIKAGKEKGMSKAMLDRLLLNEERIENMAKGLKQIASLPDPIGEINKMWKRPNGIMIGQMRVPLGVIGIIYEARPNVTVDATALCIKSGNAVILKGGSEAMESNKAISKIISCACENAGLPVGCINFIDTTDRGAVNILLKLNKYIDVIIPRGSGSLINFVVQNSTVPVIQTGEGNCHIFIDKDADLKMGVEIVINAKIQRPAVCNAAETLLVHRDAAEEFLPMISTRLFQHNVEIRGCEKTLEIINRCPFQEGSKLFLADEKDWETEFLDLILAVRIVDSIEEAMEHIYKYSTKHSEVIVTNNYMNSQKFLREVDSAAVYVNASSRFTDGFEFGFGGEIGISTQKLHARGPMGLNELTSIKYVIYGEGQIRK
jgi:glutamate-5-semialdehyde dehydrogenase